MIPPFAPDMVSDLPAEISTDPPFPDPLVVALICPWSSCIRPDGFILISPHYRQSRSATKWIRLRRRYAIRIGLAHL